MTYYGIVIFYLFIGVGLCGPMLTGHLSTRHIESINTTRDDRVSNVPQNVTTPKDRIEIKVYYETLCPFSKDFFVSQLKPTVQKLGSYLDIQLIPYGHATTRAVRGRYKFSCQHGIYECYGNAIQACAIDVLQNTTKTIYFNTCLMRHISYRSDFNDFFSALRWCGAKEKVNIHRIWNCLNSNWSTILLKRHGDVTQALRPTYVPYLVINGELNEQGLDNLLLTVCLMIRPMPSECETL